MKKYIISFIVILIGIISIVPNNKVYENTVVMPSRMVGNTNVSNLTIKNTQSDNEANSYTYSIKLNGLKGSYRYTINNEESYLVFTAQGSASIDLKSNDTLIIYDIPINTTYTIEQNRPTSYKTLINNVETTMAQGVTASNTTINFDNVSLVEKANPVTSDKITYVAIILFVAALSAIVLKNIKVKRYE